MNDNKAWNSRNYNYWNQQPNVTSNNLNQMSYVAAASQQTNSQNLMGSSYGLGSIGDPQMLPQQQQQQGFHRMNTNVPSYIPTNVSMGGATGNTNNAGLSNINTTSFSRHNSTCSSLSSLEGSSDVNRSSGNSARSSTNSLHYSGRGSFGSNSGITNPKFVQRSNETAASPYSYDNAVFNPLQVPTSYFSNYEYTPRTDTAVSNLTLVPPDSTATTNTTNTGYGKLGNTGSDISHGQVAEKLTYNGLLNEIEKLKMELTLKNQMINNLSEKLNQMKRSSNNGSNIGTLDSIGGNVVPDMSALGRPITIPGQYTTLFKELNQQLKDSKKELEDTKLRLELLVVGLAMSPREAPLTASGQFDEQEIAHRIVSKLQILTEENENLIKMMSFGSKSSLLVELGLLRQENKLLREKFAANGSK